MPSSDIDPWKIVSLQLDMINNERILEEGPLYCQTSTSFLQMEAERSMLGSCGFQENRPSHFQQFFNNCHDQPLLSSSGELYMQLLMLFLCCPDRISLATFSFRHCATSVVAAVIFVVLFSHYSLHRSSSIV